MNDIEKIVESLKELSDLELEIIFIDSICKKLKQIKNSEVKSETLLLVYLSIIETLKKYKTIAQEGKRDIPHKDAVDLIIDKGESFLSSIASDETRVPYTQKSLLDMYDFVRDFMVMLKKELTADSKYAYLKHEEL